MGEGFGEDDDGVGVEERGDVGGAGEGGGVVGGEGGEGGGEEVGVEELDCGGGGLVEEE